eukprot:COSAG06_NODE_9911_length_1791_cov_2.770686_1_plen_50_part_00
MAGGRRHAALMIEKKIRGVTTIKRRHRGEEKDREEENEGEEPEGTACLA